MNFLLIFFSSSVNLSDQFWCFIGLCSKTLPVISCDSSERILLVTTCWQWKSWWRGTVLYFTRNQIRTWKQHHNFWPIWINTHETGSSVAHFSNTNYHTTNYRVLCTFWIKFGFLVKHAAGYGYGVRFTNSRKPPYSLSTVEDPSSTIMQRGNLRSPRHTKRLRTTA